MRLIDADKLTGALNLWGCYKHENPKAYDTLMLYEILGAIEDQPTAYDVDKVISEIDKCSIDNTDWGYSSNPKLASYYLSRTAEVIDIVKKGGVDERKN